MLPTPPMGGPPMMPMMGPPPHGMMPGGPGKKRIFLTKLQLMLMCLIVLSQPGCVRQIHFIQTRQANKAVSFTSIRSAFSKAYYWSQIVFYFIFFIFFLFIALHFCFLF